MKDENPKPIIEIVNVSILMALALVWLGYAIFILTFIVRKFGRNEMNLINSVIFLGMSALFTFLTMAIFMYYIIRVFYEGHESEKTNLQ